MGHLTFSCRVLAEKFIVISVFGQITFGENMWHLFWLAAAGSNTELPHGPAGTSCVKPIYNNFLSKGGTGGCE